MGYIQGKGKSISKRNIVGLIDKRGRKVVLDGKVKVSSNDTNINYLENKLTAGTGVSLTINNEGGDENIQIVSSMPSGTDTQTIRFNGTVAEANSIVTIATSGKVVVDTLTIGRGNNELSTNTAIGFEALAGNNTEEAATNVAVGYQAMHTNTSGYNNVAVGYMALKYNLIGIDNIAIGYYALLNNETGNYNTAIGSDAISTNVSGSGNVAVGYQAGYYETGSNKLFIDNIKRADEADGRAKALIYGIFGAITADQFLTINGNLNISTLAGTGDRKSVV